MRLLPKVRHVVNIQICWKHKGNANKSFAKGGVGSNQLQRKGTLSVRLAHGQKRKKMVKKKFFLIANTRPRATKYLVGFYLILLLLFLFFQSLCN